MCRSQANYCGNFNCSLKYSVRSILDLFQGIGTMFAQSPQIAIARVVLIFLGFLLVYLGVKGTLDGEEIRSAAVTAKGYRETG